MQQQIDSVVAIKAEINNSAYGDTGVYYGTGFIANKKGYVVSNAHIAGRGQSGSYYVTFSSGEKLPARNIYNDVWQDLSILAVDPVKLPQNIKEVKFSKKTPKEYDKVFII